jgi:hypothetical protein
MQNPFRLFKKDDAKRSIDLVERIQKHEEKNKPLADATFAELDAQAIAIAGRLNDAKTARSPTAGPLEAELNAIIHRRESAKSLYTEERNRLYCQLAGLTKPVIDRFVAECQFKRQQVAGPPLMQADVKEKVFNPIEDRWMTMVSNNYHVIQAARELLDKATKQVGAMQHLALDMIQSAIAEFETAFEQLNFDDRQETEVPESRLQDFLPSSALSVGGKMDSAWLGPSSSPHSTSGGWQMTFIGGRE